MIRAAFVVGMLAAPLACASTCFGSPGHGCIDDAVALPLTGPDFIAYSDSPITSGSQFVHASVAAIVQDAFADLRQRHPGVMFMFGETGLAGGGPFKPHKTHQNGLSVDFFVPVRDLQGRSVLLPTVLNNRYGYDIEFDIEGRYVNYRIDFPALAEYLHALHRAAARHKAGFKLVILEPAYVNRLMNTDRGAYLRKHVRFMRSKPWVRHDEHFHIDFDIRCEPLAAAITEPAPITRLA